jgi:hypothetical protein
MLKAPAAHWHTMQQTLQPDHHGCAAQCSLLRLSSGNDAGCAKASSAITTASFSQATYTGVFKSLELPLQEYCAGSNTPLYVYAQQVTMSVHNPVQMTAR